MRVGREVERHQSADGKHLLRIFRRDSDFYFTETSEVAEGGETFWTSTQQSEIYATLDEARAAATAAVPWFKNKS